MSNRKDLQQIRTKLLDRKVELEEKLAKLSKEKVSDDQVQDPGDQAMSNTMETLRISWQDTELAEYNRIKQALTKIDDGTYGICVDCDQEISEKRLNSFPNAARCIRCQEAFEEQ